MARLICIADSPAFFCAIYRRMLFYKEDKKIGILELLAVAVGLSMDAFAVSICKGLSVSKVNGKHMLTVGLYFGGFQALMPYLGYCLGSSFSELVSEVDHWIAFGLLSLIGINMIRESRSPAEELDASFSFKAMLPLAVATSIDALAVGVSFAFMEVNIYPSIAVIGVTTLALSAIGVKAGNLFGAKNKSLSELIGGIVLIAIGLKILLQDLGLF